jgi:hypothetical protein
MCSSCGSQIDPKKGKLESGYEITLTLHTQGERWMDGWMDRLDGWMSLFPNYFYIDKTPNPRRKGALKMSITYHHATSYKLTRGWMHTSTFHNSFFYSTKWGLS